VQTIQTTAEHPVYALQQGWVEAGKLQAGDTIAEPNGAMSTITAVRTERHPQGIAVYNFRVQDAHTYFVRAEGSQAEPVWVHNNCAEVMPEADGTNTFKILNKFAPDTIESVQLRRFVQAWNEEILKAGGSMTRRTLSAADMADAAEWRDYMTTMFPERFGDGVVVGHAPDAAAGGVAAWGRSMPLLDSVNSYLGWLLKNMEVGTKYHQVVLHR
jgi:hypothetical protein